MHTCMMPVAPNRLVNISSVLEYASVLIGVHQVKYMEVQTMDAVKILMVDDEERMRKLVKDFLTIKGYRVLEAGDGEQAIDIFFKEKDISLVILDSGCHDAEDGRLGDMQDDSTIFSGSDHHADGEKRGAG